MDFNFEMLRTLSSEALECQEELKEQRDSVSELVIQLQGMDVNTDTEAVNTMLCYVMLCYVGRSASWEVDL